MAKYNSVLDDKKTVLLMWLDRKGILQELYAMGVITAKPKVAVESRLRVAHLMSQGVTKRDACQRIANQLGVHVKTVYVSSLPRLP